MENTLKCLQGHITGVYVFLSIADGYFVHFISLTEMTYEEEQVETML